MSKILQEAIGDAVYKNTLNEVSMAADIGKWEPLLFPLIHKIYPDSLVEQIASIQPTKSPLAKVTYLNAIYSGDNSNIQNDVHWTNSRLMTLDASASSAVSAGGTYTISGGADLVVAKVFHGELTYEYVTAEVSSGVTVTVSGAQQAKYWNILVACVTGSLLFETANLETLNPIGSVVAGNTINGETILYTTTNRNTIKKVFKDYSTVVELNTNLREVNFETATKTIETTSRKIRSKFSQERLQDLLALYNEKAYDIVAEAVANEIRQEIDREVISYLKNISTPMRSDINIPLSVGNGPGGGLDAMTYDVAGSIFLAAEEIIKATKRNRTMFILADSATCSFLLLNPFHAHPESADSNPYYVGKFGVYDLFCDPYATEHYVIVGYNFKSKDKNDAGLYFCPYTTTIHEVTSGDSTAVIPFSQNFMVMNRFGYTVNPQDSGVGHADSDFFRIFSVNFYEPAKIIPNFPEQFRTNY
jgi:hypothetical protein